MHFLHLFHNIRHLYFHMTYDLLYIFLLHMLNMMRLLQHLLLLFHMLYMMKLLLHYMFLLHT